MVVAAANLHHAVLPAHQTVSRDSGGTAIRVCLVCKVDIA